MAAPLYILYYSGVHQPPHLPQPPEKGRAIENIQSGLIEMTVARTAVIARDMETDIVTEGPAIADLDIRTSATGIHFMLLYLLSKSKQFCKCILSG